MIFTVGPNNRLKMLTIDFQHDMVPPRFGISPFQTIAGDTMCECKQALPSAPDAQRAIESVDTTVQSGNEPTYSVSTWDHEIEQWHVQERRATKWDLRRWLRMLYAESWDTVSILIERND